MAEPIGHPLFGPGPAKKGPPLLGARVRRARGHGDERHARQDRRHASLDDIAAPAGPTRRAGTDRCAGALVQHYRDDLADAHDGTDPDILVDMATNFGGALLRMLRLEQIPVNCL